MSRSTTRRAQPWRVAPGPSAARRWIVKPDLSSAFPFLAAAVVTGGTVRCPVCRRRPCSRSTGTGRAAGSDERHCGTDGSHLEVRRPGYSGLDVVLHGVGELTRRWPLAALAAPGSVSTLRGVAHLRGTRPTDWPRCARRSTAWAGDCRRDGRRVDNHRRALPPLLGAYADHRMAISGAIVQSG